MVLANLYIGLVLCGPLAQGTFLKSYTHTKMLSVTHIYVKHERQSTTDGKHTCVRRRQ